MVVQGPHNIHGFTLPWMGVLEAFVHAQGYGTILGPGLEHLHPKIVSVKPQLALPYYPPAPAVAEPAPKQLMSEAA